MVVNQTNNLRGSFRRKSNCIQKHLQSTFFPLSIQKAHMKLIESVRHEVFQSKLSFHRSKNLFHLLTINMLLITRFISTLVWTQQACYLIRFPRIPLTLPGGKSPWGHLFLVELSRMISSFLGCLSHRFSSLFSNS